MSDSVRPHRRQPTRLHSLWDSPGKNTGVGCHFLLQGLFPAQGSNPGLLHCRWILYQLSHKGSPGDCTAAAARSLQSCPTLCNPIDGSPPGSSFHGILQARTLENCLSLLQCRKVKSESEVTSGLLYTIFYDIETNHLLDRTLRQKCLTANRCGKIAHGKEFITKITRRGSDSRN